MSLSRLKSGLKSFLGVTLLSVVVHRLSYIVPSPMLDRRFTGMLYLWILVALFLGEPVQAGSGRSCTGDVLPDRDSARSALVGVLLLEVGVLLFELEQPEDEVNDQVN